MPLFRSEFKMPVRQRFGFADRTAVAEQLKNAAARGQDISHILNRGDILRNPLKPGFDVRQLTAGHISPLLTLPRAEQFGIKADSLYGKEYSGGVRSAVVKTTSTIWAIRDSLAKYSDRGMVDTQAIWGLSKHGVEWSEEQLGHLYDRLGAHSLIYDDNGNLTYNFKTALIGGLGTATAVTFLFGLSPAALALTFVASSGALTIIGEAFKHSEFGDIIRRTGLPLLAAGVMLGVRGGLSHENMGYFVSMLGGYLSLAGVYTIRGTKKHYEDVQRVRTLMKEHENAVVGQMCMRLLLDTLQAIDKAGCEPEELGNTLKAGADLIDRSGLVDTGKTELKNILRNAVVSSRKDFDGTIADLESRLAEYVRSTPDFKVPNQSLISLAKATRIMGAFSLLPVAMCMTSKGLGAFGAADFYLFTSAAFYWLVGSFHFSRLVENAEQVEVARLKELPEDKEERPALTAVRYSNKGFFRDGKNPGFLNQDFLVSIKNGNYSVVMNNDSPKYVWFEAKGAHLSMEETVARAHVIFKKILPKIKGLSALDEETRLRLSAALSLKDFSYPTTSAFDNAINFAYPDAPPDGRDLKFRNAIGVCGGEVACYEMIKHLAKQSGASDALKKIENGLYKFIVDKNNLNAKDLLDGEALLNFCRRIGRKCGLSEAEIGEVLGEIEKNKEYRFFLTVRDIGVRSGVTSEKAHVIARHYIETLKSTKNHEVMAEIGEKLILGLDVSKEEKATLTLSLKSEFRIGDEEIDALINEITPAVHSTARAINERIDTPDDLYAEVRDFMTVLSAWEYQEPTELPTEEGNILKVWMNIREKQDSQLTPGQKHLKDLLVGLMQNKRADEVTKWLSGVRDGTPSQAVAIARTVEGSLRHRGLFGKKERMGLAMDMAHNVTEMLASSQPFGKDLICGSEPMREAREEKRWLEFLKGAEKKIRNYIRTESSGGNGDDVADIVWAAAKEELKGHKNIIDRATNGFLHTVTRELFGLRAIAKKFASDGDFLKTVYDGVAGINKDGNKALEDVSRAMFGKPASALTGGEKKKLGELSKDLSDLLIKGIGTMSGNKGYLLAVQELIYQLPFVLLGLRPLLVSVEGNLFQIPGTMVEKYKVKDKTKLRDAVEAVQRLAAAEAASHLLLCDLEDHIGTQEDAGRLDKKLVLKAMRRPLARFILSQASETQKNIPDDKAMGPREYGINAFRKGIESLSSGGGIEVVKNMIKTETTLSNIKEEEKSGVFIRKGAGLLLNERDRLITEIDKMISSGEIKDIVEPAGDGELKGSYRSPFIWSRLSALYDWKKGKAVNTNFEFLGSRVYETLGSIMRHLIKKHEEEKSGFFRVPTFLQEKFRAGVTEPLRFSSDENRDWEIKVKYKITQQDIARNLTDLIFSKKMSSEAAAAEIWEGIEKAWDDIPGSQDVTKAYYRVKNLDDIKTNIRTLASEVAVLSFGHLAANFESMNAAKNLVGDPFGYLNHFKKFSSLDEMLLSFENLSESEKRTIRKMSLEIRGKLSKDAEIREKVTILKDRMKKAEALEEKPKDSKSQELLSESRRFMAFKRDIFALEDRITYRGPWYTAAAQFTRNAEGARTEFIIPRARSLEEEVAWMNSIQYAAERSVERGKILEDALMLRKAAAVADKVLGTRMWGKDWVRNWESGKAQAREFRSFSTLNKDGHDKLEKAISDSIKAVKAELGATERMESGSPVVNFLDETRFQKPSIEARGADIQINADTDNIFYPEMLDAAGSMGYRHGIFADGNKIEQWGLNYDDSKKYPIMMMQRDRDLNLPRIVGKGKTAGAVYGSVLNRWKLGEGVATLTGYANLFPVDVAMEVAEYTREPNVEQSAYKNQVAYEAVFNWALKKLGRNPSEKAWFDKKKTWADEKGIRNWWINTLGWDNPGDLELSLNRITFYPAILLGAFAGARSLLTWNVDPSSEYLFWASGISLVVNRFFNNVLPWFIHEPNYMYQYLSGRRIYHIHPSEDLATTASVKEKGHKVRQLTGARELNDCTTNIEADQMQKLRWMASNAALLIRMTSYYSRNTNTMSFREYTDLVAGPLYNIYGAATMINRLTLLGFIMACEPSMLLHDPQLYTWPIGSQLQLLIETSLVNYGLIHTLIRYAGHLNGLRGKWLEVNFAYENTYAPFNYKKSMERLFSKSQAGFNPSFAQKEQETIPLTTDQHESILTILTWKGIKNRVMGPRIDGPRLFLRKNADWVVLNSLLILKIMYSNVYDAGYRHEDFMSLGYLSLLIWLMRDIGYSTVGLTVLNNGIAPARDRTRFEKENGVWDELDKKSGKN